MRKRRGFISNSSSSSFIISAPKEQTTINLTLEVDLDKTGEKIETEEELREYIFDNFRNSQNDTLEDIIKNDEYAEDIYKKCLAAVLKGDYLWVLTGSSEDIEDAASIVMYENSLSDLKVNANIIQE
jgi:hypothetical protein